MALKKVETRVKKFPQWEGHEVPEWAQHPKEIKTLDCFMFLHSAGGEPALVEWENENSVEPKKEEWYKHGSLHRPLTARDPETGRWLPAVIIRDWNETYRAWYFRGRQVNFDTDEDGKMLPCQITENRSGKILYKTFVSVNQTKILRDIPEKGMMYYKCSNRGEWRIYTREEFDRLHTEMTEELLEWKAKWMESATKSASKNPQ